MACGHPVPGGDANATGNAADDADSAADSGDSRPSIDDVPPECPDDVAFEAMADRPARELAGRITWTLDFDAVGEADGYVDCAYTRNYPSLIEDNVHGWVCPECEWLTTGDSIIVEGYDDCYTQIDTYDAEHLEHFGFGTVEGESHLFRAGKPWVRAHDLAVVEPAEAFTVAWSDEGTMESDGAAFVLSASGEMTMQDAADVLVSDPRVPRTAPYTCGDWPQCNPGGDNASWTLETGAVFPNARLLDQCEEPVDIWDFAGRWLVIDSSSPNCGPCQALANDSGAWLADMETRGYHIEIITLLNESLSSFTLPADVSARQKWANDFDESGPVLGDEGFGYGTMPAYLGKDPGTMSFPSIIVVGPDLKVRGGKSGYSTDAGFADIEALITGG